MIGRGLSQNQIRDGVTDTPNATIQYMDIHGKGFRVKLSVLSTRDGQRYYRTSSSGFHRGRKVSALCYGKQKHRFSSLPNAVQRCLQLRFNG